ncbi:nucleoside hydrolase [Arcticibacterium luteifluviistationis]|uniref:Nucleoside hydrolase n=1 Tax=Arcticibacterium luteifluviistationis TaxID=1784714 RepID=A0A2Z4G7K1_9BACT|nr:nucleoside hydrolase [Arcticibacterium luteifluviistationis]AWV97063.1 nucleoside hydrolase [Arcticibacterium luteifluviistationis]
MKKVWIDTDLSVGMKELSKEGYCDVDDGYAVLQLMKSDKVDILGISAIFGNTTIENALALSQFMSKEFADNKIPVYEGSSKALDYTDLATNDAVEAMAAALKQDKVTIMAIGPATNVGILLLKHPELKEQIEQVVLVAGRRKPTDYFEIGNMGNHAKDLNFDLDNDAFRILLESGVKTVLCPFEISKKVWVKQTDLEKLAEGDAANKWISKASEAWLAQWVTMGAAGFNPFDVLASHYIISPEDIISEELYARLELHSDDTVKDTERKAFKQYLLCDDKPSGFPVTYCYDVVEDYQEKLMGSLV